MASRFKNSFAQMTVYDELILSGKLSERALFDNLNDIFDSRLKFPKRQAGKGMADIRTELDSHVADRKTHMDQTGNIIEIMADRLGLNGILARNGMRAHDCGHPFGSHEGEEVLNIIGVLLNAGFFHHNAKGTDVALSEDIIEKFVEAALKSIDDSSEREKIRNDPKMIKRLEDDAWYFLEFIVGHDGEATLEEMEKIFKQGKKFNSIKEAVLYYTSRSNRKNIYKSGVTTLEAVLAKPSDIISYLKIDVENSFRKGIVWQFSDDYLECLGELLLEDKVRTPVNEEDKENIRNERIKNIRKYIRKIEFTKLRESSKNVFAPENEKILEVVKDIIETLEENGIYTYNKNADTKTLNQIHEYITNEIDGYIAKRQFEGETDENILGSERNKIIDWLQKLLKTRQGVVEQITEEVKQTLIDDYCSYTSKEFERIENDGSIPKEDKKSEMMQAMNFSPRVRDIVYRDNGIKNINYEEYVQYTKREFQINALPKAVFKGIKMCSDALVKTGVIRDKFYDKSILSYIDDENVKRAMNTARMMQEKDYIKYKEKIGINEFRVIKRIKRFTDKIKYIGRKGQMNRHLTYKEIYAYTQRQGERFALTCEDVYYAIPFTILDLVKKAIDSQYKPNQYLKKEERQRVYEIRRELKRRFGEGKGKLGITTENLIKYIEEKIEYERTENFANNVASEIAIKYIGGYGNDAIRKLMENMGCLRKKKYERQDRPSKEVNESLAVLIKNGKTHKIDDEDDKGKKKKIVIKEEIPEEKMEEYKERRRGFRRNWRNPPLMELRKPYELGKGETDVEDDKDKHGIRYIIPDIYGMER